MTYVYLKYVVIMYLSIYSCVNWTTSSPWCVTISVWAGLTSYWEEDLSLWSEPTFPLLWLSRTSSQAIKKATASRSELPIVCENLSDGIGTQSSPWWLSKGIRFRLQAQSFCLSLSWETNKPLWTRPADGLLDWSEAVDCVHSVTVWWVRQLNIIGYL